MKAADTQRLVSQPKVVQTVETSDTDVVDSVVDFFDKVEKAVGEVERAVRKGLTNAKFGLGPAAPGQFSVGEPIRLGDSGEQPKSQLGDSGEQPKSQLGDSGEQPKSQLGPSHQVAAVAFTGDLRVDLAFARVVELFRQVGQVLQRLEQATLEVEITARDMLSDAEVQHLDRKIFCWPPRARSSEDSVFCRRRRRMPGEPSAACSLIPCTAWDPPQAV